MKNRVIVQFAATRVISVKAPGVLPTIALVP